METACPPRLFRPRRIIPRAEERPSFEDQGRLVDQPLDGSGLLYYTSPLTDHSGSDAYSFQGIYPRAPHT